MNGGIRLEQIACPLCGGAESRRWGAENGFSCVKCQGCGLVYVNPRPTVEEISHANEIGEHRTEGEVLHVVYKRSRRKALRYATTVRAVFPDIVTSSRPVRWLDIGAGFGELVEVLQDILPAGSQVMGIEPMAPKVAEAQARGLPVYQADLSQIGVRFDVISLINVFSHVPDFRDFLGRLRPLLKEDGELFIETGNGGDLSSMRDYPDLLYLPDHLVFAGEEHLRDYLAQSGFTIASSSTFRVDTAAQFGKNLVKAALGRRIKLTWPYRSPFRRVLMRAKIAEPVAPPASWHPLLGLDVS
ncbi:MAG TPA: class I SAM-dependent methyltransferase [Pseudolabrys sp.]|nr:class I SAM-dependent methyltransferase [Pseudolabrys sp.]